MSSESIAEKCGIPKNWSLGWVIDEFDSSFDTLAMASLRYHMNHAVTVCEGARREAYQSMLDEFEEITSRRTMTHEHVEHYASHRKGIIEMLKVDCEECERHLEEHRRADDQLDADKRAARRKFVDLMPGLWS